MIKTISSYMIVKQTCSMLLTRFVGIRDAYRVFQKKRIPSFIFGITLVIQHRF